MSTVLGNQTWAIPEGYIPEGSTGPEPEMESHETVCVLNAGDEAATVELTVYFADRDPLGPYEFAVPARRTRHVRFNDLTDPEPIPRLAGWPVRRRDRVPVRARVRHGGLLDADRRHRHAGTPQQ